MKGRGKGKCRPQAFIRYIYEQRRGGVFKYARGINGRNGGLGVRWRKYVSYIEIQYKTTLQYNTIV